MNSTFGILNQRELKYSNEKDITYINENEQNNNFFTTYYITVNK